MLPKHRVENQALNQTQYHLNGSQHESITANTEHVKNHILDFKGVKVKITAITCGWIGQKFKDIYCKFEQMTFLQSPVFRA